MSEWKDLALGPCLRDRRGFRPEYSLCCTRHVLNALLHKTVGMPASPFVHHVRGDSGTVMRGQPSANQEDASGAFTPLRLANRPALR
jgi:hypothetical protein